MDLIVRRREGFVSIIVTESRGQWVAVVSAVIP
jgi:hypothetical protein